MKLLVLLACFGFLCLPRPAWAGSSAVGTIEDVKKALETKDEALFNASVDMESLVGQCVDIFMEDANKDGQTTLPPMLAMLFSAASRNDTAKQTLRSTLVSEVSAFVRSGVASGAYAGQALDKQSGSWNSGILAPFFANASMGRKEIFGIGNAIPESGAVYVTFSLRDHANGHVYPVEAWLREETAGQWRVIGLRNVRTLVRLLRQEAGQ